ncbi:MAG TPA: hypothetical protein VHF92_05175 [Geodermatophilus sp.]|nr:hypothetical protein [Geodermatophilus sp.]
MTTVTAPAPVQAPPAPVAAGEPARRHAGCYWDLEVCGWVPCPPAPPPRAPRD